MAKIHRFPLKGEHNPQKSPISTNKYTEDLEQRLHPGVPEIDPNWFEFDKDEDFENKIELDIKGRGAIENLLAEVAGLEWFLVDRQDQKSPLEKYFKGILLNVRQFLNARMCLGRSVIWGLSVLKVIGEFRWMKLPGDTKKRRWWVPVWLVDIGRNRLRRTLEKFVDENGEERVFYQWHMRNLHDKKWEPIKNEGDFIWAEFQPKEDTLGYGNGLGKSLYYCYRLKAVLTELLAIGAERFADSWIIAKIRDLAEGDNVFGDADKVQDIIDTFEKMRAFGIAAIDAEHDVSTMQASSGEGYRIITDTIDKCDRDIIILLSGSNLGTEIDQGGSFAATQAQNEKSNKRMEVMRQQAVSEPLTDYLIPMIWRNNYPNFVDLGLQDEQLPELRISGGTVFDATQRLPVFQFAKDSNMEVAESDVREQLNLSPVTSETDVANLESQSDIGGQAGGLGGGAAGGGQVGGPGAQPLNEQGESQGGEQTPAQGAQQEEQEPGFSHKGTQKFAKEPEVDKDVPESIDSDNLPQELLDKLNELGMDIFRQSQGVSSNKEITQEELADLVGKVMAFYDVRGRTRVIERLRKQLEGEEKEELENSLLGEPIREVD